MLAALALTVPLFAGSVTHSEQAALRSNSNEWEQRDPAALGFDGARLDALLTSTLRSETNIHSILIERHGKLVAEHYRDGADKGVYSLFTHHQRFGPDVLHDTRSIGKSVVSLLLGIAIHQRKIGALATPVLDFYPDDRDLDTPERRSITLAHLLTMSSGLAWSEGGGGPDNEHRLYWTWSVHRYLLSRAVAAAPGGHFNYNSGGTAVLADILTRQTRMPLKDFARKELFEPLGILDWEWTSDIYGRPLAFAGLRMRPRDIAKLGRLVLNRGQWDGRQIVPADWIAASLQPRIRTGIADFQYGYQWWAGTVPWQDRKLMWSATFGNGGQRLFVVPELDLTVVMTAGAYGDPRIAPRVNALFYDIVTTVQK
jgi:CubicO group peptidase (beta-lactamase class C family)